MKKLLFLLFFFPVWCFAQTKSVTPAFRVKDPPNNPLDSILFNYANKPDGYSSLYTGDYLRKNFSQPDGIISGLAASISGGNVLLTAGQWRISSVTYHTTGTTTLAVSAQPTTQSLYDVVYATTSNTLGIVHGDSSATPVPPNIPAGTVGVVTVLVTPTSITTGTIPTTLNYLPAIFNSVNAYTTTLNVNNHLTYTLYDPNPGSSTNTSIRVQNDAGKQAIMVINSSGMLGTTFLTLPNTAYFTTDTKRAYWGSRDVTTGGSFGIVGGTPTAAHVTVYIDSLQRTFVHHMPTSSPGDSSVYVKNGQLEKGPPLSGYVQKGTPYTPISGKFFVGFVDTIGKLITDTGYYFNVGDHILHIPNITLGGQIRASEVVGTNYAGAIGPLGSIAITANEASLASLDVRDALPGPHRLGWNAVDTAWEIGDFPGPYYKILTTADIPSIGSGSFLPLNLTTNTTVNGHGHSLTFIAPNGFGANQLIIDSLHGIQFTTDNFLDNGTGGQFTADTGMTHWWYGDPNSHNTGFQIGGTNDKPYSIQIQLRGDSTFEYDSSDYNAKLRANGRAIWSGEIARAVIDSAIALLPPNSRTLTINGTTFDLSANRTWSVGTLTNSNFIDSETPSGTINSSNVTFTLANTPVTGSVHLYRNGVRVTNFTVSTATITMSSAPLTGDTLLADYRK